MALRDDATHTSRSVDTWSIYVEMLLLESCRVVWHIDVTITYHLRKWGRRADCN